MAKKTNSTLKYLDNEGDEKQLTVPFMPVTRSLRRHLNEMDRSFAKSSNKIRNEYSPELIETMKKAGEGDVADLTDEVMEQSNELQARLDEAQFNHNVEFYKASHNLGKLDEDKKSRVSEKYDASNDFGFWNNVLTESLEEAISSFRKSS
jgi:hypothetical protein